MIKCINRQIVVKKQLKSALPEELSEIKIGNLRKLAGIRVPKKVTLNEITVDLFEVLQLIEVFDTLGNNLHIELVGNPHNTLDEDLITFTCFRANHK